MLRVRGATALVAERYEKLGPLVKYLPLLLLAIVFVGMLLFSRRNRQRAALTDAQRRSRMGPGSAVMTTSGLYGTVLSVNADDQTVMLSIAPAVEVKWALAALRDVTDLPQQYRGVVQRSSGSPGRSGPGVPSGSEDQSARPDDSGQSR